MVKVIVCGPKHSGKSVFVANLKELLPRNGYFVFRAQVDGEGTWSNKCDQELAQKIRHKGKFDETFMHYVLDGLKNVDQHIPLTLVDVGGIRSPENREIFKVCDYFIVVSSNEEETKEWMKFGIELGLKPLAVLKSELNGAETIESCEVPIRGIVSNLERGTYQLGSKLLGCIATELIKMIETRKEKKSEERNMNGNAVTITVDELANQLGKAKEKRTLPNGKDVEQVIWRGEDIVKVDEILRTMSANPGAYVLDGPAPAFLGVAFVHGLHPQGVSLNDPRLGPVGIAGRKPEGAGIGKNLKFSVKENGEFSFVEFEVVGGTFDVADLDGVRPPVVNTQKGVVISGRGPNWLVSSLAMGYHTARWVALWQPGSGATVAMTHHPSRKLGDNISDETVKAVMALTPISATSAPTPT